MDKKESESEKLGREAQQLRQTALDMMEHAILLINKSLEIDQQIGRMNKKRSLRKEFQRSQRAKPKTL